MNFNTDQFLAHFFKTGEKIVVDANELQAYMRDKECLIRECKRLAKQVDELMYKTQRLNERLQEKEFEAEHTYTLNLVA